MPKASSGATVGRAPKSAKTSRNRNGNGTRRRHNGAVNSAVEPPPPEAIALPVSVSADYRVGLAETPDEVRAAQELRFAVFNLERGEGLESSFRTGLDRDAFDRQCAHILVWHNATGELAGTYRAQSGRAAAAALGYYSEQEFDFSAFEPLRSEMIEVGRACVHRRHRNLAVLGLLWKGIARYAREAGGRYLVGCSSLSTQEPEAGWGVYERLSGRHLSPEGRRTRPLPGWECPPAASGRPFSVPKLMQAYLALGAEICGPPALDRQFGTIDFLTFLDLDSLHPAARRRFME